MCVCVCTLCLGSILWLLVHSMYSARQIQNLADELDEVGMHTQHMYTCSDSHTVHAVGSVHTLEMRQGSVMA